MSDDLHAPDASPTDPLMASAGLLGPDRETPAFDVAEVYRQHRRRLIGLAAAVVLDGAIAEEIVHDAFVGLQQHRERVNDPVAYLQRSVVNLGIKRQRRRQTAARHPLHGVPPASTPELDDTWQAVTRLPTRQRAVIALRFWEDLTLEQIAGALGCPVGSVKSTLHRALRHLEEELR